MMPSYGRATTFGEPVMIAEFGCLGDGDYAVGSV
jgi:beta-mannanase